ncbi:hypothetical protein [Natrinema soli]|uniref:Lipoprotein n=1 Tax=Natrinema soli TaxID=1930624 RepID=A0ABD5SRR0_9EURY|nr:hypothetical protein [Natrinema soli]
MDRREYLLTTGSIAIGLLSGCLGADSTQAGPGGQSDATQWYGEYTGTAQVTTLNISYSGEQVNTYSQYGSYQTSVVATIAEPGTTEVNKENNPVHLAVGPDPNSVQGAAGEFHLISAGRISTEDHPELSVLQPWNLQLQENALTGVINHELPSGHNFFYEKSPGVDTTVTEVDLPPVTWEYMAGTTLTAQLNQGSLQMEVTPPAEGAAIGLDDQKALAIHIACELSRQ